MKKQILILLLIVGTIGTTYSQEKNYILVHGSWHGAWSWNKVVPLLEKHSHKVIAQDLPGHGNSNIDPSTVVFDDLVNSVIESAQSVSGRVILVGHSSAGVVIAQASERLGKEKVESLVFLDAFMPENGESVISLAEKKGKITQSPSLNESMIFSSDQKTSKLQSQNVANLFYHDCTMEDIEYALKNICATPLAALVTPVQVSDTIYGSIPKVYILCTDARDLDKTNISKNVPSKKIIKLKSSHSPFYSMPDKLVDILVSL